MRSAASAGTTTKSSTRGYFLAARRSTASSRAAIAWFGTALISRAERSVIAFASRCCNCWQDSQIDALGTRLTAARRGILVCIDKWKRFPRGKSRIVVFGGTGTGAKHEEAYVVQNDH